MAISEDQHEVWAREAKGKSLDNISRIEEELRGLRATIENDKPLSLGRTNLLSRLLDGVKEVDGAW